MHKVSANKDDLEGSKWIELDTLTPLQTTESAADNVRAYGTNNHRSQCRLGLHVPVKHC